MEIMVLVYCLTESKHKTQQISLSLSRFSFTIYPYFVGVVLEEQRSEVGWVGGNLCQLKAHRL